MSRPCPFCGRFIDAPFGVLRLPALHSQFQYPDADDLWFDTLNCIAKWAQREAVRTRAQVRKAIERHLKATGGNTC